MTISRRRPQTPPGGRALLAISAVVALLVGWQTHAAIKPAATASTHVFVDTAGTSVVSRPAYPITEPVAPLLNRTELLGRMLTSPPLIEQVASRAGVPAGRLAAEARLTLPVQTAYVEPGSEERASEIRIADLPYRIEVEARPRTPILDIYTRAPSTRGAERLATAAVGLLSERVAALAAKERLAPDGHIVLRQLGDVQASVTNRGMGAGLALMAFLITFGAVAAGLRRLSGRRPARSRPMAPQEDDLWPHTTRLLPWSFAAFLAMVWLVPFDQILLKVPSPIDLSLDRLLLPVVALIWALSWLMGGRGGPQVRWTRIHSAVALFVAIAFASVILNASALNQSLELDAAVKRLPLLIAYVFVFFVASTAVHSREVRAFLTYVLGLALVCALGVLWEYRFKQNLFHDWSDKILPGVFHVQKVDSTGVDELGRRMVQGPAVVPLEAVAMLAMALPIPLVRLIQAQRPRDSVLHGLAACLLFAAVFATFRKSGLLAPLSVVAAIAFFRRRELLKLAPLALVLVVLVPVLAPGAVATTVASFTGSGLEATTVSDRTSDYDAIRPDLWSHLLVGRGWGSYNHVTYRILDSEILQRLIEMGVLGLLAYALMIGSVVWTARPLIAERDPTWAPLALCAAAAAVSFAVVSTLFDALSFPQGVYIFLSTAGLVAAVIAHRADERRVVVRADAPTLRAGAVRGRADQGEVEAERDLASLRRSSRLS